MYKVKKGDPFYVELKSLEKIWFCKPDPKDEGCLINICRIVAGLTLVTFLQVGPALHIIKVARIYDGINMSEALGLLVGSLGFNLVYMKTSIYHHRCRAICKDLVDHKRFGKPRTFDVIQKRCRFLATFFLLYCPGNFNAENVEELRLRLEHIQGCLDEFNEIQNELELLRPSSADDEERDSFEKTYFEIVAEARSIAIVAYAALVWYENRNSICEKLQLETEDNLYCSLMYPLWFPIDISRPIIFTIQTVCLLIYETTFVLISHIDFLLDHLDEAFCEKDEKKRYDLLRHCVQYHIYISKMGKGICSLHEKFTGHMAVVWAGSLGCICNQLLHSGSVADKLYEIPWYMGTIKEQKCIMLMIIRAQTPITLSATPFGNYDCRFFIMIKMSLQKSKRIDKKAMQ
nr:unnamed protein product [Callosobruchus chinensis]